MKLLNLLKGNSGTVWNIYALGLMIAAILLFPVFLGTTTTPGGASCECGGSPVVDFCLVNADLDGQQWKGPVQYEVIKERSGEITQYTSVTGKFGMGAMPMTTDSTELLNKVMDIWDTFTIRYISGGPEGVSFIGIRCEGAYLVEQPDNKTVIIRYAMHYVSQQSNDGVWTSTSDGNENIVFLFTNKCMVDVNATLDGKPWTGPVNYTVSGANTTSGSLVPQKFSRMNLGTYKVVHNSGAPFAATLKSITPASATLGKGNTGVFTLNFETTEKIDVEINATLDGKPWKGYAAYEVNGPEYAASPIRSMVISNLLENIKGGKYTVKYLSGGPLKTDFTGVTSTETNNAAGRDKMTFSLNFRSLSTIKVQVTLDGKPWQGAIDVQIDWPSKDSAYTVIHNAPGAITDVSRERGYKLTVTGGGPDAFLEGIFPNSSQVMYGAEMTFTISYVRLCKININATLDGKPWQGNLETLFDGPEGHYMFYSLPGSTGWTRRTGEYTVHEPTYSTITGAVFTGIDPAPSQFVEPGGELTFTLKFVTPCSITVTGTLYTSTPWQGDCAYEITGDTANGVVTYTGTKVPFTFYNVPPGIYNITYLSGAPEGYVYHDVLPEALQVNAAANKGVFKMRFILEGGITMPPAGVGADLAVTLSASSLTPLSATNVIYTITVTNYGPLDATGVKVTFPRGVLTYVSDTGAGAYNSATGLWTIGNLTSGSTVSITVTLNTGAWTTGTVITNTARVSSTGAIDPVALNDQSAVTLVLS